MGKVLSTPRCSTCDTVLEKQHLSDRCFKCAFYAMREPLVPNNKPSIKSTSIDKISELLGVDEHQVNVQLKTAEYERNEK